MRLTIGFLTLCLAAFAQSDRGIITGTVSDPAGAVVAGAALEARSIETGALYQAASTDTGNYTLAQLPVGTYELSVTVPGFKKYVRPGLTVQVAQTVRIDVVMEVGAATESVTVNAETPLLKTESGDLSHNTTTERVDDLPILEIGAAGAVNGLRDPLSVMQLSPGTYYSAGSNSIKINGAPTNSETILVEGQDASNGMLPFTQGLTQQSVDSIQEVSIQTSNYAAEFGQVGGGLFNFTTKSGTNQFHGSAYDYFVNEILNAAQPFVNVRPPTRQNDFGGTVGGPVRIPKLYNGRDKTFFFFNFEEYYFTQTVNNLVNTVPTTAFRNGNFGGILTGRVLGTDPLGRPILENTIYNPASEKIGPNGIPVRDPFPGNIIPLSSFDPVAQKVQALIPLPNFGNPNSPINNGLYPFSSQRTSPTTAFKIDQLLGPKAKVSAYWSRVSSAGTHLNNPLVSPDGFSTVATSQIGSFQQSITGRLNFDYTLSPTLLLHLGAGWQSLHFSDDNGTNDPQTLDYNALQQLGLQGAPVNRLFPYFTGLASPFGGSGSLGPSRNNHSWMAKPTFNATLTRVEGNHTYKTGAEFRVEGYPVNDFQATAGQFTFGTGPTGLPSTIVQPLPGSVGFPYASFLLGDVSQVTSSAQLTERVGKTQLGLFVQDSWKVTRKLTLDYGLRYDYSTYLKDGRGLLPDFSPSTPNPAFGGLLGAPIFEGNGPGHCNCQIARNYPWGFGPRFGAAYQITPKTVFRAGAGVVYDNSPDYNILILGFPTPTLSTNSLGFDEPVMTLAHGIPLTPKWPNFSPGQFLSGSPMTMIDPDGGRTPRQIQWSIGLQREITPNLVAEASYVGNRGAWWQGNALNDVNGITPQALAADGLNINSAADRSLLTSTFASGIPQAHGFQVPYATFPVANTLAQALRPFPQYGQINSLWSPLGDTWYDSLQAKVTKRLSHGLDVSYAFTWQKSLALGVDGEVNDAFNRQQNKYISSLDQPLVSVLAANYTLPIINGNKWLSWAVRDWRIGTVLQYASGLPIEAPFSNNQLNQLLFRAAPSFTNPFASATFQNRVPGQPLYLKNLNCHCFDPNTTLVLNPAAWTDAPVGQFGTAAAYYNDYRYERHPQENLSFGREFGVTERVRLSVRAEFTNVFNRTQLANPASTNAEASTVRNAIGQLVSGFGYINTTGAATAPGAFATTGLPRQGQLVGRITF